jgi:ribosomal protein S18 acetylase RimI-like enzyme
MSIQPINETIWDDIIRIQAEVYFEIEPEDLNTLHSKWLLSPDCCFVYQQHNKTLAYLLAHAWNSEDPPKLSEPLSADCQGPILLLHDLAVSSQLKGFGVGKAMINHLFDVIKPMHFEQIRLVSIQNSVEFWRKQGFTVLANEDVTKSYGKDAVLMQRWLSKKRSGK